jgi:hypothetical protein
MCDDKIRNVMYHIYQDLAKIEDNLRFVMNKVPSLDLDDETPSEISAVCNNFYWTVNDCKKELRNAEDKLGFHPKETPVDPGSVNPDPRVNIEMLENWLSEDINKLHELVTTLQALADKELHKYGVASILVTESAAHIINAYNNIREETARLRVLLDQIV